MFLSASYEGAPGSKRISRAGRSGERAIVFYDYIYDPESKIMAVTVSRKERQALPTGSLLQYGLSESFASLMPARFDTFASTMTPLHWRHI